MDSRKQSVFKMSTVTLDIEIVGGTRNADQLAAQPP